MQNWFIYTSRKYIYLEKRKLGESGTRTNRFQLLYDIFPLKDLIDST